MAGKKYVMKQYFQIDIKVGCKGNIYRVLILWQLFIFTTVITFYYNLLTILFDIKIDICR